MAQQPKFDNTSRPAVEVDFKALIECTSDVILQFSRDLRLVYASPSVTKVLGWTPEEMYVDYLDIICDADRDKILATGQRLARGARGSNSNTFRVATKAGDTLWMEAVSHVLQGDDETVDGIVVTLRDISAQKDLEARVEELSRTDSLTGLANRRTLDTALAREWAIARREGDPLSLIMVDLDHFKALNGAYGPQAGDECLQSVGELLRSTARRPADIVARYGGEEFAIVLPNTHAQGAQTLAAYLQKAIEDLNIPNAGNPEHGGRVTASLGVVTIRWPSDRSEIDYNRDHSDLMKAADSALYEAKTSGRNTCCSTLLQISTKS